MWYKSYSHRFGDRILYGSATTWDEIKDVLQLLSRDTIDHAFHAKVNAQAAIGKQTVKGKQRFINELLRQEFVTRGWQNEYDVFATEEPADFTFRLDFLKNRVGIEVSFNHAEAIGSTLMRLQAAHEVRELIDVGLFICATKSFAKWTQPNDHHSMTSYERVVWMLRQLRSVVTVPILVIGLEH